MNDNAIKETTAEYDTTVFQVFHEGQEYSVECFITARPVPRTSVFRVIETKRSLDMDLIWEGDTPVKLPKDAINVVLRALKEGERLLPRSVCERCGYAMDDRFLPDDMTCPACLEKTAFVPEQEYMNGL